MGDGSIEVNTEGVIWGVAAVYGAEYEVLNKELGVESVDDVVSG